MEGIASVEYQFVERPLLTQLESMQRGEIEQKKSIAHCPKSVPLRRDTLGSLK